MPLRWHVTITWFRYRGDNGVTLREFDKIAKPTNLLSNSLSQLIEHGKRTPKHLLDYFQLQVRLPLIIIANNRKGYNGNNYIILIEYGSASL